MRTRRRAMVTSTLLACLLVVSACDSPDEQDTSMDTAITQLQAALEEQPHASNVMVTTGEAAGVELSADITVSADTDLAADDEPALQDLVRALATTTWESDIPRIEGLWVTVTPQPGPDGLSPQADLSDVYGPGGLGTPDRLTAELGPRPDGNG